MMKTLSITSLVSLVMFTAACHRAQSPGESAASNIVPLSSPCRATVEGTDVSGWREVVATDFTFCVPADWRVVEGEARHGSATVRWGSGAVVRESLGKTTGPVGAVAVGAAISPLRSDVRRFSEEIGGRLAQLFRTRYGEDKYYSGAAWETPAVSLSGESRTARETDTQIAIYRTVRFTP